MVGLLLAGAAHVALAWVLVTQRPDPAPLTPPERITVSLAEDVGLDSAAPDPSPDPAAAMAPELAPLPQPPVAAPPPPLPPVRPTARPTPTPTPRATRTSRPTPTPTATRSARPTPTPSASRSARPTPAPTASRSARPTPAPTSSATRAGAGRISENFLDGTSDATGDRGQAADRASPQQQASIAAAVIRQLKPHWNPPSGVDVDRLVTVVRFRLNRDGSLNGTPEVVRQTGENDNNRLQASRHAEQALRAVRLAAGQGFDLPTQFYSEWDVLTSNFDNRLAQ
jgi:outer membrane biosynthesis protein TonB